MSVFPHLGHLKLVLPTSFVILFLQDTHVNWFSIEKEEPGGV